MNKNSTSEPKVIWNSKCKLGEGTLWVKEHNSIYFVDCCGFCGYTVRAS